MKSLICLLFFLSINSILMAQNERARDLGIEIGIFKTGGKNAITDVPNVAVGHTTKIAGSNIRTGVTAIIAHDGNLFQQKLPAAIYIGNGFGKLAGYSQVEELGNIETPIVLTNTLSVSTAIQAVVNFTLGQPGNENVRSVNAVVGETNDGRLNDIRGQHVTQTDVLAAINSASHDNVAEGNVGAGTGTVCFGFKGGIGTSSRVLPKSRGGYTVGVLVQTNFGGVLEINGIPVAKNLGITPYHKEIIEDADGSCMIVVITDAPVDSRNLKRMAKRAMLGLAKTGGIASNGSGDYVIAVSNNTANLIPYNTNESVQSSSYLTNNAMTPLFLATIEATEEAIINSLLAAKDMEGKGKAVKALDVGKLKEMLEDRRQ